MPITPIPEPTLRRLPMYYHYLSKQKAKGRESISCTYIANDLDLIAIQVRKDLQIAGAVGKPKIGYNISELIDVIGNTLGYNNINDAFLVGAGNLGQALLGYKEFSKYGLNIVAAFDISPFKISKEFFGKRVFPITKMTDLAKRMNIQIGIITTNAPSAQKVADAMVESGIKGIWNFAPVHLNVPENIIVQNENLATSLSMLLSKVKNQ